MSFPPYDSYKPSGVESLGDLPAHWDAAPLKALVTIENGADYKSHEVDSGFPVIGSGGPFAQSSLCMYDGESVLLGRKGTIDKPLYVNGPFWAVDTMYWSRIHEDSSGRYCYYATLTIPFGLYSTNTALPSMTKSVLSAHRLPRPPLAEQQAIAAFLDRETAKIDALVAEQERLIELLKEKRQAVISHAVTKGIDPSVPMKDSGIEWLGEVPAHWALTRLKTDLGYLTSGSRGWAENYASEGSIFVRIANLTRDSILLDLSDVQHVQAPDGAEGERTLVREGDVLFSITAYLGSVAIVPRLDERAYVSQHVALARLGGQMLLPAWVAYSALSSVGQTWFALQSYGGTKIQLSLDDVRCMPLLAPPLPEQHGIVDWIESRLDVLNGTIASSQSAIKLLTERRSALISAAVTGQIDVRDAVPVEVA